MLQVKRDTVARYGCAHGGRLVFVCFNAEKPVNDATHDCFTAANIPCSFLRPRLHGGVDFSDAVALLSACKKKGSAAVQARAAPPVLVSAQFTNTGAQVVHWTPATLTRGKKMSRSRNWFAGSQRVCSILGSRHANTVVFFVPVI